MKYHAGAVERPPPPAVAFGPFELHLALSELRKEGRSIPLEPKVIDLLQYLIEHRDRLVTGQELHKHLWPDTAVGPSSLRRALNLLRDALEDDARKPRWIATVHRRGYRFIGEVKEGQAAEADYRRLFLGRDAEQTLLSDALLRAKGGASSLLLVEGEAGVGKSRLLEWCAEAARSNGLRCIVSQCREDEGAPPLWPWMQVIRLLATSAAPHALQSAAPDLAHIFPDLALVPVEASPVRASDPRSLRFQAYEGMRDLLSEICRTTPLALFFDDLHRADASSLALLEFLAAQLSGSAIVFVGSMRPEGSDRKELTALARNPRCRTLALGGLGVDHVQELLLAAAPEASSSDLAREIWQQTGGNAFFVHQVLPIAARMNSAAPAGGSITRVLPRTVRKAIEHQHAALSEDARVVLRSAAVFGREFSVPLLAQVLDRSMPATSPAIDEAVQVGLLTEAGGRALHYRYVHILVRDVLYEGLGSHERARLHGAVGSALEAACSDPGDLAAELAHHFAAEGTRSGAAKASHYHTQAAEVAATRFDHAASVAHYRRALELAESLPGTDPGITCDLRIDLARQSLQTGWVELASSELLRTAEQARRMNDPARLISVALEFSAGFDAFDFLLDARAAYSLLAEAARFADAYEEGVRARLFARMAHALDLMGSPEAADEVCAQAPFLAKTSDDPLAMAAVLRWEHLRRRGTPAARERADIAVELVRHAQRAGRHDLQLAYSRLLMTDLARLGEVGEWEREISAYARQAERLKSPQNIAWAHRARATRALMRGDFSEARTGMQKALTLAQHCDPRFTADFVSLFLALELETAGATPMLFEGLARLLPSERAAGALILLRDVGRPEQMREHIAKLLPDVRNMSRAYGSWHFAGAVLADTAAYLHDAELAEELLERFDGFEEQHVFAGMMSAYSGPFRRYIGLLQGTLGRSRQALESLEAALASVRALEARPMEARIQLDLATLRGRRSDIEDRTRAVEHAREGLRIAEQLGMPSVAQRARGLAG